MKLLPFPNFYIGVKFKCSEMFTATIDTITNNLMAKTILAYGPKVFSLIYGGDGTENSIIYVSRKLVGVSFV